MGNSSGAVAQEENATAAEDPVAAKDVADVLEETAPPSSGQAVKAAAAVATPVKTQNGDWTLPTVSAIDGSATKIQAPPPTSAPPPVSLPPEPLPPAGTPVVPGADSPGDERLAVSPGKRYVQPPPPVQLAEDSESSSEEDPDRPKPELILGPDGLPSVGSAGHDTGDCKRCCFFPKDRCSNGHDCRFCHYDHAPRKRLKKKKGQGSEAETPNHTTSGSVMDDLGIAASPPAASPPASRPPLSSPPLLASPTPMGAFSTPLGRQGLPLSPMPTRIPLTPVTPTAPPMAPPTLTKLNLEEALPPPPPPATAPALPDSPAEAVAPAPDKQAVPEISITNTDAVASKAPPGEGPEAGSSATEGKEPDVKAKPASMETSPALTPKAQPAATPHGAKPTPVTLNDLLVTASGQKPPDGPPLATVPNGNGCVVHSKDAHRPPRPLLAGGGPDQWPMGYWNPWPYYGDQPAVPLLASPQALPKGPPPPASARMPVPPPYAGLPPAPIPVAGAPLAPPLAYGALPCRTSPVRPPTGAPGSPLPEPHPMVLPTGNTLAPTSAATGGMDGDSPRSVLLTLCGAWGALKTSKEDGKEEGETFGGISRSKMLAVRSAAGDEERPAALKTFKALNLAREKH